VRQGAANIQAKAIGAYGYSRAAGTKLGNCVIRLLQEITGAT
jgi:hypothetical protein